MKYLPPQYKSDAYIKVPELFCFEDQKTHLIDPPVEILPNRIGLGNLAEHFDVIKGQMGSGKTHTYNTYLIYKIFEEAESQEIKDGVIIITAPDRSVVESNKEIFTSFHHEYYKDYIRDETINTLITPAKNHITELTGYGFEVVICTIQAFQGYVETCDMDDLKSPCLAVIHDEAHKGLGCPSLDRYKKDMGRMSYESSKTPYRAKWFQAARDFPAMIKLMFTGTPTDSMLIEWKGYYKMLSMEMISPTWRLPFLSEPKCYSNFSRQLEGHLESIAKKNAVFKHYKKTLSEDMYKELFETNESKFTGLIKCCQADSINGMTIKEVQEFITKWNDENRNTTFKYKSLVIDETTGDVIEKEETLYYKDGIGDYITMIDKSNSENDYDDDDQAFSEMRNPNSNKLHLLVVEKGAMGINVPNFCSEAFLRDSNKSDEEVTNNEEQFFGRLARCIFVWPEFLMRIFNKYSKQKADMLLRLAIEIAIVSIHHFENEVQKNAVKSFKPLLIAEHSAYDVLMTMKNTIELGHEIITASGKDRDGLYRKYKKDRCERLNCSCYENFVTNPPKDSFEEGLSLEERKNNYDGMLEVHHKDGDRENSDPKNLETNCSNSHRSLTMQNKDYLNVYDTEISEIV
jgi:hypothetical protein